VIARARPAGRSAFAAILLTLLLAACATERTASPPAIAAKPPAAQPAPPLQPTALALARHLPDAALALPADAAPALAAFRRSCPAAARRQDLSGLTRPEDWQGLCDAAAAASDAAAFFRTAFAPVTLGQGFTTGYYEPEIAASLVAAPGYATPLYRRPPDLIEADLGKFADSLKGKRIRGRVEGQALVPYYSRAEVMAGALAGRGLELAWAADPHEAFFLEIQGSGRLRLPSGEVVRIGYDGQNGRDYVAIGRVLIDRGELPKGGAIMDAILGWLRAHPAEAPALLATNPSVVFFKRLTGDGPVGALGAALTPGVSAAADPAFTPLGVPLLVSAALPSGAAAGGLRVAQDTGGAIKGPARIDLFYGAGAEARAAAGALASPATVILLLPRAAASRLPAVSDAPPAQR
jgi:membrane-bound lytic murein transglycosylase A